MSRPVLRLVLVLILGFALTTPGVALAQPQGAGLVPIVPNALGTADLIVQAWNLLLRLWAKEGCELDLDGQCLLATAQTPPPIQGEEGCGLDPNGLCIK
jgi:hypothetical protein